MEQFTKRVDGQYNGQDTPLPANLAVRQKRL